MLRGATSLPVWLMSRHRQTRMPTAPAATGSECSDCTNIRRSKTHWHRRIKCSADPVAQATVSLRWWDSQTVACFESILRVRFFGPTTSKCCRPWCPATFLANPLTLIVARVRGKQLSQSAFSFAAGVSQFSQSKLRYSTGVDRTTACVFAHCV